MVKYLQLFFIALFPYLIVFVLICMFTGYSMDNVFHDNVLIPFSIFIGLYVVALISSVITFIKSLTKKRELLEVLRINMIIKLIHVPAYLCIFIVGLGCMITIFTFGITIVLMILDGMTIVLSGLIGLGGVIRSLRENKISITKAVIHSIFQFVFCADIISSIVIYSTVKAAEYDYKHNLRLG